jgi:hypothetical protein
VQECVFALPTNLEIKRVEISEPLVILANFSAPGRSDYPQIPVKISPFVHKQNHQSFRNSETL